MRADLHTVYVSDLKPGDRFAFSDTTNASFYSFVCYVLGERPFIQLTYDNQTTRFESTISAHKKVFVRKSDKKQLSLFTS